jgi:sodium pump decarboxylase gamma subunit
VNLINQGVSLTLIGMATVFFFLALLVVVMVSLSAIVRKFFPETEEPAARSSVEAEVAVAIAAVKAFTKS